MMDSGHVRNMHSLLLSKYEKQCDSLPFIIIIYYDARSSEFQIQTYLFTHIPGTLMYTNIYSWIYIYIYVYIYIYIYHIWNKYYIQFILQTNNQCLEPHSRTNVTTFYKLSVTTKTKFGFEKLYSWLATSRRFESMCSLSFQTSNNSSSTSQQLKTNRTVCLFQTSVNTSPATRRHTPEYPNPQQHSCDNLRSFTSIIIHRLLSCWRRW